MIKKFKECDHEDSLSSTVELYKPSSKLNNITILYTIYNGQMSKISNFHLQMDICVDYLCGLQQQSLLKIRKINSIYLSNMKQTKFIED